MTFKTEQEDFWAGSFGSQYIARNQDDALLPSLINFFARSLRLVQGAASCIEFGANIGLNLKAIKVLHPEYDLHGVEINADAAGELAKAIPQGNVHNCSILDFKPGRAWDLALIKGVLIHIAPEALPQVYDTLVAACRKHLLVAEYYNPSPVAISYRGEQNKLFKRDFAGEILDRHSEMRLVDYGFVYRRDPNFPDDDITWFLLEKRS